MSFHSSSTCTFYACTTATRSVPTTTITVTNPQVRHTTVAHATSPNATVTSLEKPNHGHCDDLDEETQKADSPRRSRK
ncbi:MAG TPA: hypothetical protein VFF30_14345 [Nitrososphaerales archaeon]|nr:hypothetical protein [Nitrososphaerales archaeon]